MRLSKCAVLLTFAMLVTSWHPAETAPTADNTLTPAQVLQTLQAGNERFVAGRSNEKNLVARRAALIAGQSPEAIVLSCSDSRVPPEIVFDQGLGNLFVVRVAGNDIDAAGMASIEYAIAHLGPKLIVVLGHTHCGAVNAALTTPSGQSAGSRDLDQLVASIQQNLKGGAYPSPQKDPSLSAAVLAQATAVAKKLPQRSPIVKDAANKGGVQIVAGVYDLRTGKVSFAK